MGDKRQSAARKASMADVARHAGVSVMTVSNVINKPEIVSEATRARVQASMDALRYRNNLVARSLRLATPRQIGYLLSKRRAAGDPYMNEFLYDLATACEARGRNLTLISAQEDEITACEDLYYGQSVAGFFVADVAPDDQRMPALHARKIPVVAYGQNHQGGAAPWSWADVDAARGLALAVDHLADLGHSDLAYVGVDDSMVAMRERLRGFLTACEQHDSVGSVPAKWIVEGGREIGDGLAAGTALLSRSERPTAIACASDQLALGVLMAARDLHFSVGRDVAITGFDDSSLAQVGRDGITSVHQPSAEVADTLVDMLIGTDPTPRHVLLQPELVVRSSTSDRAS